MPLFYLKTVTYVYSLPVTYLTTLYTSLVRFAKQTIVRQDDPAWCGVRSRSRRRGPVGFAWRQIAFVPNAGALPLAGQARPLRGDAAVAFLDLLQVFSAQTAYF